MSYIEIGYISPISTYNFDNVNIKYTLVILSKDNHKNIVWEVPLNSLQNITNQIRGYPINKVIKIKKNHGQIKMQIYGYNRTNNTITLYFSGILHNSPAILYRPKTIKTIKKQNLLLTEHYFLEIFHNDYDNTNEKCAIFIYNKKSDISNYISSKLYTPLNKNFLINRYDSVHLLEYYPQTIKFYNALSKKELYRNTQRYNSSILSKYNHRLQVTNFINDFFINKNKHLNDIGNWITTDDIIKRTIDSSYRPLYHEDNKNNIVVNATDGRVTTAETKKYLDTLKSLFNFNLLFSKNHEHNKQLLLGSCYVSRLMPQDNRVLYCPYDGYVTGIKKDKNVVVISMINDYFMAPSVLERDQFSVAYGKCLHFNRGCSERLAPQPRHVLRMSIVIIGGQLHDKLNIEKKPLWVYKGEKIGYLDLTSSIVVFLSNRKIVFVEPNIQCGEEFIRAKDIVGYVQ